MKQFYLAEIVTKDKLIHQGIFCKPSRSGKKAILWVHGLSGKFYGDPMMMELFADRCEEQGWGFAAFNNRGHDLISSTHTVGGGYFYGGAGYERFEDCIIDIHAAVDFLVSQGFSQVYLVGHSTGALKAAYSEAIKAHKHVAGIILAGGLPDRLGPGVDHKELAKQVEKMEKVKNNKLIEGLSFFPMTARRFVSLNKKSSAEEVFDYGEENPKMTMLKRITKPLFVIVSENDEYLDRPAKDVVRVFDEHIKSKHYKSMVFPAANHGFTEKERAFVDAVSGWIEKI